LGAIEALTSPGDRIVLLSGFESRPNLIGAVDAMARTRQAILAGNSEETVTAVKDPATLFPALAYLGIPFPPTRLEPPDQTCGWLSKQVGGAGGAHLRIDAATDYLDAPGRRYWQKHCAGTPASVQVLANGDDAVVLGFCEQWTSPTIDEPYRFGGVALWQAPPPWAKHAEDYARTIVRHFGLKGLISVDLLIDSEQSPLVIEINPRPGQSLDLFRHIDDLMTLHCQACEGRLPDHPIPPPPYSSAVMIAYAPHDGTISADYRWPREAADIPEAGRRIAAGRPLATIVAHGPDIEAAKQAAQLRLLQTYNAIKN
jgi:predicted ATP-grasp superfamily ATP-dependent carboligase